MAKDSSGNIVSLKHLHCDKASQMLGVWLAPNGNKSKIITELKKVTIEWGAKSRRGHTPQPEAWTALHSTIFIKVKYPLPACTLNEK